MNVNVTDKHNDQFGTEAEQLSRTLEISFEDKIIFNDLRREIALLSKNSPLFIKVFDEQVLLPPMVKLTIVSKSVTKTYFDLNYDWLTLRSIVALGETPEQKNGFLNPEFGFVSAIYNSKLQLITFDFHDRLL